MTVLHTADLEATPMRDRSPTAAQWAERPDSLPAEALYRRRIGPWLLWRLGPPKGGDTTYVALHVDDFDRVFTFHEEGIGPSGAHHSRFRTWKEDLRDTV